MRSAPRPACTRTAPARTAALAAAGALALALAWTTAAPAQVRECATDSGQRVFTDRSCRSLGATEVVRGARATVATRVYHAGCAATLQDLVYELTTAIDSRDVNRLAAHYHWPGMSGQAANATLDRLDAIAARPLLDLRIATRDEVAGTGGPAGDPYAAPEVRVVPTGLRLEQLTAPGGAPVTTALALRRHQGCWWVRL